MHLLQNSFDISVNTLWLVNESNTTAQGYAESDLAMKESALKQIGNDRPDQSTIQSK